VIGYDEAELLRPDLLPVVQPLDGRNGRAELGGGPSTANGGASRMNQEFPPPFFRI
jgi:hypothetical protein